MAPSSPCSGCTESTGCWVQQLAILSRTNVPECPPSIPLATRRFLRARTRFPALYWYPTQGLLFSSGTPVRETIHVGPVGPCVRMSHSKHTIRTHKGRALHWFPSLCQDELHYGCSPCPGSWRARQVYALCMPHRGPQFLLTALYPASLCIPDIGPLCHLAPPPLLPNEQQEPKILGLSRQALPHLEAQGQVRQKVAGSTRQQPHPEAL